MEFWTTFVIYINVSQFQKRGITLVPFGLALKRLPHAQLRIKGIMSSKFHLDYLKTV